MPRAAPPSTSKPAWSSESSRSYPSSVNGYSNAAAEVREKRALLLRNPGILAVSSRIINIAVFIPTPLPPSSEMLAEASARAGETLRGADQVAFVKVGPHAVDEKQLG